MPGSAATITTRFTVRKRAMRLRSRQQRRADLHGLHHGYRRCRKPVGRAGFPMLENEPKPFLQLHKDGSVWARGQVVGDVPVGYWEWFRTTGTISRSGHFDDGRQVGEWTTYDREGRVYKVTVMKRDGKRDQAAVDPAKNQAPPERPDRP